MVMLASYESSQHCAGVVTCLCLLWKQAFHRLSEDGFLQTSTGFASDHYEYTSAVSCASVGLATI